VAEFDASHSSVLSFHPQKAESNTKGEETEKHGICQHDQNDQILENDQPENELFDRVQCFPIGNCVIVMTAQNKLTSGEVVSGCRRQCFTACIALVF
jgi:hypothetical protein